MLMIIIVISKVSKVSKVSQVSKVSKVSQVSQVSKVSKVVFLWCITPGSLSGQTLAAPCQVPLTLHFGWTTAAALVNWTLGGDGGLKSMEKMHESIEFHRKIYGFPGVLRCLVFFCGLRICMDLKTSNG